MESETIPALLSRGWRVGLRVSLAVNFSGGQVTFFLPGLVKTRQQRTVSILKLAHFLGQPPTLAAQPRLSETWDSFTYKIHFLRKQTWWRFLNLAESLSRHSLHFRQLGTRTCGLRSRKRLRWKLGQNWMGERMPTRRAGECEAGPPGKGCEFRIPEPQIFLRGSTHTWNCCSTPPNT